MNQLLSTEVQLLAWYKSTSKSGPRVVLLLQNDDEISFFESLTLAKGKTAGQILDVNFKLSPQDDQSQDVSPEAQDVSPEAQDVSPEALKSFMQSDDYLVAAASGIFKDLPKPTGPRCREAVGVMKEKDFSDFVRFVNMEFNGNDTPQEYIQIMCGIVSRREFDEGPDADEKYTQFCAIKKKYREWQRRGK